MTSGTPFYGALTYDGRVSDQLQDNLANNPAFKQIQTMPKAFREVLAAWIVQPVHSAVDPILAGEVTKGGHAEGRSVQKGAEGEGSVTDAPVENTSEFYVRPNGDKYYHRPWGDRLNDVEVLRKSRECDFYTFLYGPPGTGKTAMGEAAFGDELLTILGTGDTEVADFVGGYIPTADGTYQWRNGPLLTAMIEGRPLLVDEIGLIDTKALAVLYGVMDGRREYNVTANPALGVVKAAKGFYVIGATNPNAPGVRISEALISRFPMQVEVLTDYTRARKMGVDQKIVSIAKNMDNRVRNDGDVSWAPQMRELLAFRDISKTFGEKFAYENLIAAAPEDARDKLIELLAKGSSFSYNPAQIRSK